MNVSLSREEVVHRLQNAFLPLKCLIKISDHEAELSFWILDRNGSSLIDIACIPMSALQDPRRLDSIASLAITFMPCLEAEAIE